MRVSAGDHTCAAWQVMELAEVFIHSLGSMCRKDEDALQAYCSYQQTFPISNYN